MDYYIRSWDPDSTYPENPQEGDVCYTITLDQSWAPVAGVKNDNLLKEEVYQSGAWVEVGGGASYFFDGTVTTAKEDPGDTYASSGEIEVTPSLEEKPAAITVKFNGVDYEDIPRDPDSGYGAPWVEDNDGYDFTDYPFNIWMDVDSMGTAIYLATETAGDYSLQVAIGNAPAIDVAAVEFTENGVYTAPAGMAFSPVTVNVSGSSVLTTEITITNNSAYYLTIQGLPYEYDTGIGLGGNGIQKNGGTKTMKIFSSKTEVIPRTIAYFYFSNLPSGTNITFAKSPSGVELKNVRDTSDTKGYYVQFYITDPGTSPVSITVS